MNKLIIAGIGPGDPDTMTASVKNALLCSDVIVGYTGYVDLIRDRYPDKEFRTTPMTKEVERCRLALESASQGEKTVLICSGDSSIYGMAALVYELRGESEDPEIEVLPGITAACSGSSLLGAPLTHDFAVISLSDRLTDWEKIQKRLEYAAMADFSIVLYNPASKGRPNHLRTACDILLKILPADLPCGIARNIGRENESGQILSLSALRDARVDRYASSP